MLKFLFLFFIFFFSSFAELEFEDNKVLVRRKAGARDSIMLSTFKYNSFEEKFLAFEIRASIKDLLSTRSNIVPILSEEVEEKAFEEMSFINLREKNIDYVVTGNVMQDGAHFNFYLGIWDVYENKRLIYKKITFNKGEEDIFVKQISTLIYEFITGEFGFFYGKLIYTLTERPGVIPFKKVAVSFVDKGFIKADLFSNGQDITFNPKYCKETNDILYVNQSRKHGNSFVVTNTLSGKSHILELPFIERKIIFSPNLSKDCKTLIFSIAEDGATNLYSLERGKEVVTKLTATKNTINTSASFFENGDKIIFTSDRTGKPRIWVMNKDGAGQKILLEGDGGYYSPSVSSDNKKVAFVKVKAGTFSLGIADIDGTNEKILHSGFVIENPVWAPIGKTIIFSMKSTANSKSRIYAISAINGEIEELEALRGDLNEPRWIDEF